MAFLRTLVRSVAFVVLGAGWLQAQTTHARLVVAPQGRPRIAEIAPPPPPPRPSTFDETVFAYYPVIVLDDGRVLVDLGNAYEQVARTCPYAYGYGCQSFFYPQPSNFPSYGPPTYITPIYAPPVYGAPAYPILTYPPGYGSYSPAPYYVGCPAGYTSTGSYPPCIGPYFAPATPATVRSTGTSQAAPPRTAPTTLRAVRR